MASSQPGFANTCESFDCQAIKRAAGVGDQVLQKGGPRLEKTTEAPSDSASCRQLSQIKDWGQISMDIDGERTAESKVRCNRHVAQCEGLFDAGASLEFLSSPEDMLESDAVDCGKP